MLIGPDGDSCIAVAAIASLSFVQLKDVTYLDPYIYLSLSMNLRFFFVHDFLVFVLLLSVVNAERYEPDEKAACLS